MAGFFSQPGGGIGGPGGVAGIEFAGEWDPDIPYAARAAVMHGGLPYYTENDIEAGIEPGFRAEPLIGQTKAGNAMFGGTNHDAYIAVQGQEITSFPGPDPGITQNFIQSCYVRIDAGLGEEITLEWEGGPIALFDGQHGDGLFAAGPLSGPIDASNSPLTFTVPDESQIGGAGVNQVAVEVKDDVVTSFTWGGSGNLWTPLFDSDLLLDTQLAQLPENPRDGQVFTFQNLVMANLGVAWKFRFHARSADVSKWEFIGGSPLYLYDGAQWNTNSAAWQQLSELGVITAPFRGEYEVAMSAGLGVDQAGGGVVTAAGVAVNGVVDDGAKMRRTGAMSSPYFIVTSGFHGRVLDLAANDVVRPVFRTEEGAGLSYIEKVRLTLRPVRIG
jgi:hypothetical protein